VTTAPLSLAARLLALALLLGAALILGVAVGAVAVGPGAVLEAMVGRGDATTRAIVLDLRLPRAAMAGLIGAGLAVAGTVFQALLRNLAPPQDHAHARMHAHMGTKK
jgi:iron complex transport system permease protein